MQKDNPQVLQITDDDVDNCTVLFIHFAGGNRHSFNRIINRKYSKTLDINRKNGTSSIQSIVASFISANQQLITTRPYIIYGHSMGALLGYLLCQKLQELALPMPEKLVISGKKAPSIPFDKPLSHLPDQEFWKEILALGGIPDEMRGYPELIAYYTALLKQDYSLIESYKYEKKPRLNVPIDVFYGSEEATIEEMYGWRNESLKEVKITELKGNHFFIFDHIDYFKKYFNTLSKKSEC